MNRFKGLVVAMAMVALLVAGAASAGTIGDRETGGWLDQLVERVVAWLGGLGAEQTVYGVAVEADGGGGSVPNSGICIDPNGRPKPCV
jgi:hypothetical protein